MTIQIVERFGVLAEKSADRFVAGENHGQGNGSICSEEAGNCLATATNKSESFLHNVLAFSCRDNLYGGCVASKLGVAEGSRPRFHDVFTRVTRQTRCLSIPSRAHADNNQKPENAISGNRNTIMSKRNSRKWLSWMTMNDVFILGIADVALLYRSQNRWSVGPGWEFPSSAVEDLFVKGFLQRADGRDFGRGDRRHEVFEGVAIVETSAAGKRLLSDVLPELVRMCQWFKKPDQA